MPSIESYGELLAAFLAVALILTVCFGSDFASALTAIRPQLLAAMDAYTARAACGTSGSQVWRADAYPSPVRTPALETILNSSFQILGPKLRTRRRSGI